MKRQWRAELDKFKADCVKANKRNITIPKEKYGKLKIVLKSHITSTLVFSSIGMVPPTN
jgi:hypothetical protein